MLTLAFNELIETDLTHSIDFALVSVFGRCQPEWFYKKRVFKNFTKSTGKHIRQSSFNKAAKKTPTQQFRCFSTNSTKIFKTPLLYNTSVRLLLFISNF